MKKTILAILFVLLPATAGLANAADRNYSLPVSKDGEAVSLSVELFDGAITIEGYEGDSIEISTNVEQIDDSGLAQVNQHKGFDGSAQGVKKRRSIEGLKSIKNNSVQLEIEQSGNRVSIDSGHNRKSIVLKIKVPIRTRLSLDLHKGGDINIDNISGAIEVETHKGGIFATGITGPLVAESHSSDIVISFDSLSQANPTSLTSHSGDIDITLSKQVAAKIKVQSYKGEIFSGLDVEFVAGNDVEREDNGKKQKIVIGGVMSTEVNTGGQSLSLATYSGNVYVRSK